MVKRAQSFLSLLVQIDWPLFVSALLLSLAGLVTMHSFSADNIFFERQMIWISVSVAVFLLASMIDWRFLRRSEVVTALYVFVLALLAAVFVFGAVVKGAQSRFDVGFFAVQPAELAKLAVIAMLARYFARRHVEIAHIRHILVSGLYAAVPFVLVFLQPDLGSAIIIGAIWFGVILVSGVSRKHLLALLVLGAVFSVGAWSFLLADYQKERIISFVDPLADIQGTGYNAYQSTIAVGSGEMFGKGIGYGTQSKLQFLPEYETDFIFAAYAEEWGFVGVLLLFAVFGVLMARVLAHARHGASNFETFFTLGVAVLFLSHFLIHVGMNMGLMPVTGTTIPFMSYGGSHLVVEFLALGMIVGMRRYGRSAVEKRSEAREFLGM